MKFKRSIEELEEREDITLEPEYKGGYYELLKLFKLFY